MRGFRRESEQWKRLYSSWDILIILDACRADYFTEFRGKEVECIDSMSAHTYHFMRGFRALSREIGEDVEYFHGNPLVHKSLNDARNEKGNDDPITLHDHWPEKWKGKHDSRQWVERADRTVIHPEAICNSALSYIRMNGQPGRVVIHFMQPHFPYIGHDEFDGSWPTLDDYSHVSEEKWALLRQAYQDNLNAVLPFVDEAVAKLDGRIIVTADHGEVLGEGNMFGHSPWINDSECLEVLTTVPYVEFDVWGN